MERLAPGHTASEDYGWGPAGETEREPRAAVAWWERERTRGSISVLTVAYPPVTPGQAPWGRGGVADFELNGKNDQFEALSEASLWARTQRRDQPKAWSETGAESECS